ILYSLFYEMDLSIEAVFVSSVNLGKACIQVYDVETGSCLKSYRGDSVSPNTLCMIGSDEYIICGQKDKPLLQAWKLNENETLQMRLSVPGKVNVLAVSQAEDKYCAVGIKEKIYFYHFTTGHQFGIISGHYQDITCLKFTSCGNYLASGGEDGFVYLWSRFHVIEPLHRFENPQIQPHFVLGQHSDKVTGIDISGPGIRGILISSSLDHSCKVFDLVTGHLRYNIVSECALTSCVVNSIGSQVFVGGKQGKVWGVNLLPHSSVQTIQVEGKGAACHESSLHYLVLSPSGNSLITGSVNGEAKVWSVTLSHKKNIFSNPSLALQSTLLTGRGAITNLITRQINSKVLSASTIECKTILSPFLITPNPSSVLKSRQMIYLNNKKEENINIQELYCLATDMFYKKIGTEKVTPTTKKQEKAEIEEENVTELLASTEKLKKSNEQLYKFCLNIF
ncbi:WD repeat-containing protein 18, partial [Armadillidium nasatum]